MCDCQSNISIFIGLAINMIQLHASLLIKLLHCGRVNIYCIIHHNWACNHLLPEFNRIISTEAKKICVYQIYSLSTWRRGLVKMSTCKQWTISACKFMLVEFENQEKLTSAKLSWSADFVMLVGALKVICLLVVFASAFQGLFKFLLNLTRNAEVAQYHRLL